MRFRSVGVSEEVIAEARGDVRSTAAWEIDCGASSSICLSGGEKGSSFSPSSSVEQKETSNQHHNTDMLYCTNTSP